MIYGLWSQTATVLSLQRSPVMCVHDLCCKVLSDIARLYLRLAVVGENWIYINFCQLMSVACI